ncbi:MAG: LD-carboxypeptidase [Candidatus Acidiferrales bacterium]
MKKPGRRISPALGRPQKPRALKAGSRLAVFAPASPADAAKAQAGREELQRLGFAVESLPSHTQEGYFAASAKARGEEFVGLMKDKRVDGVVAMRGGYGSNYLLEAVSRVRFGEAKCVIGFSDLTTLQIYLWERYRWVTFYGPMIAAGFDAGPSANGGYDKECFLRSMQTDRGSWSVKLNGDTIVPGKAEGRLLGGCMTLVETTIGTPWELETRGAILVLEDRGMKPWQVDRALMHLRQAGKFDRIRGIVLGDFPECEPPMAGSPTVRDVCARILGALGVPVVFGAPVGHTQRPMLTVPLGVKAQLSAKGEGVLEVLEPAVVP